MFLKWFKLIIKALWDSHNDNDLNKKQGIFKTNSEGNHKELNPMEISFSPTDILYLCKPVILLLGWILSEINVVENSQ